MRTVLAAVAALCAHEVACDGVGSLRGSAEKKPGGASDNDDVPYYNAACLKDVPDGTWESIVECTEFGVENYYNQWCDDYAPQPWKEKFICGNLDSGEPKTFYALVDASGTPTQQSIECYIENGQRYIKFPAGRFELNEQVWVPPRTSVIGFANPNSATDIKDFAQGQQTYFVVYDAITWDRQADLNDMSYCVPSDHDDPATGQSTSPYIAKTWRKGFLMHSDTSLQNVLIQGSDEFRPSQNGNLCGGGAIETPGCISHYGGNFGQIPVFDTRDPGVVNNQVGVGCHDYWTFKAYGPKWVTGGYIEFEATKNVKITSVRVNDPELRVWDPVTSSEPSDWPATQVGLLFPGIPDGTQYLHDITVTNYVGLTSLADGVNLHTSMYDVSIVDSYIANTGDDALAIWAGPTDVKDVTIQHVDIVNPGARQNPPYFYSFGSCFAIFGFHSVTIDGLRCWDRTCPQADEADDTAPPWGMCQDFANGHLIVVRRPDDHDSFDGHYGYGNPTDCDDCGPATITIPHPDTSSLEWYYLNTLTPVDSSDPIGYKDDSKWVRASRPSGPWLRNKIQGADQLAQWGDAVRPQICTEDNSVQPPKRDCQDISVR